MKTKGRSSSIWAIGTLAAVLAAGTPAFAQHGGGGHGGGGHGGGGGGGHASMGGGGGGHASMGGRGGGFSGGHAAMGSRGGFAGGGHFAPGGGYAGFRGGYAGGGRVASASVGGFRGSTVSAAAFHGSAVARVGGFSHPGFAGRSFAGRGFYGPGFGHGGFGYHRPYWGGGYWHGGFWPRCYYGGSYPWFLGVLPGVYATYWWGGVPYYYANDVYYTWNSGYNGYVVTDPPPTDGATVTESSPTDGNDSTAAGDSAAPSGGGEIYAYPKSGQSDEQQATDRYECHKWAVAQSGFDPTHTSQGSGNSVDYRRAMGACLDGRGYSAK